MALREDTIPEGIDPNDEVESAESESVDGRKKRGRPKGGDAPKYGRKKAGFEVEALAQNIIGIHKLIALATGVAIFEITDDEGKRIAVAFSNLAAQYDVVMDPRTVAWINFVGVLASVYVPKYMLIRMAMEMSKTQQAGGESWSNEKVVN